MIKVSNWRDYRFAHALVTTCPVSAELEAEVKRAMRAFTHHKKDDEWRIDPRSTDDSICVWDFFDVDNMTQEEINDAVDEYRIVYRPTYYDCTGQIFTTSLRWGYIDTNRIWVIHHMSRDV